MLGGLMRWLRIIGHDTAYESHIEDEVLVRRCLVEGRVLLTRDRRLLEEWRIKRALLISEEKPLEQLREVVMRLDLDCSAPLFLRCTLCNTLVQAADRASVRGRVPERIWQEKERFARCTRCDRIYWEGSHTRRMRARLEAAIPELRASMSESGG
jgi:uncharacterized protein with PIN domain